MKFRLWGVGTFGSYSVIFKDVVGKFIGSVQKLIINHKVKTPKNLE